MDHRSKDDSSIAIKGGGGGGGGRRRQWHWLRSLRTGAVVVVGVVAASWVLIVRQSSLLLRLSSSSSSSSSLSSGLGWGTGDFGGDGGSYESTTSSTPVESKDDAVLRALLRLPQQRRRRRRPSAPNSGGRREDENGGDDVGAGSTSASIASPSSSTTTAAGRDGHQATLALLFPPGLQGGYRNQVLRFVALCHRALLNNQTLFLPSLWWSTQRRWKKHERLNATSINNNLVNDGWEYHWYPVPMDLIFDVEHWNEHATRNPQSLPLLVGTMPGGDGGDGDGGECWSAGEESLGRGEEADKSESAAADFLQVELQKRGHLIPLANYTNSMVQWPPPEQLSSIVASYNPRRLDLLPLVAHCRRPFVYGGGTMAGRLWNEYLALSAAASSSTTPSQVSNGVYASVLRALQPRPEWRRVGVEHCLRTTASTSSAQTPTAPPPMYAALHARIEPEMMAHPCGRNMERNLTAILDRVATFWRNNHTNEDGVTTALTSTPLTTLVVAVSRDGLADPRFPQFQELSTYNVRVLDRYTTGPNRSSETTVRLLHDRYRVLECGGEMMSRYYPSRRDSKRHDDDANDDGAEDRYGTLLEQVINFDVAVNSKVFVGVDQSSYSNAVWTTRFLLHKGPNYRYTQSGIEEVVGLPPPHANCARGPGPAQQRGNRKPKKKGR